MLGMVVGAFVKVCKRRKLGVKVKISIFLIKYSSYLCHLVQAHPNFCERRVAIILLITEFFLKSSKNCIVCCRTNLQSKSILPRSWNDARELRKRFSYSWLCYAMLRKWAQLSAKPQRTLWTSRFKRATSRPIVNPSIKKKNIWPTFWPLKRFKRTL